MQHPTLTKSKKTAAVILAIAMLAGLSFSSCKKDSEVNPVTEEEAMEVIAQTVSPESGGLAEQTEIATTTVSESSLSCDETSDTSFSGTSEAGAAITYNYNHRANTKMICDNGLPSQFEFNFTGENSYSAPRMSSADNNTSSLTISGLNLSDNEFSINQTYTRNGGEVSYGATLTFLGNNQATVVFNNGNSYTIQW